MDLGNIFNQALNAFPGVASGNLGAASVIPSLATAFQQYNNAGRYEDIGREASQMASPVSLDTRRHYQDRLAQLYKDPAAFLQGNPEFMANMRLGEGALAAQNSARGHVYDGKASTDQLRFLSDLSSRYINQERDDLMNMGGFQFNPAHGAEMLMRGSENRIRSEGDALQAAMAPLGLQTLQNRLGGGLGNLGGGGGSGGFSLPQGLLSMLSRLPASEAASLFNQLGQIPGGLAGLFGPSPETDFNLSQLGFDPSTLQMNDPTGTIDGGYSIPGLGYGTGFDGLEPLDYMDTSQYYWSPMEEENPFSDWIDWEDFEFPW